MRKIKKERTAKVMRNCLHCAHVWEEELTNEEIRKTIFLEPIGICPNEKCQQPT